MSESKRPVMGGNGNHAKQGRTQHGTTNRDWWLNLLDHSVLYQQSRRYPTVDCERLSTMPSEFKIPGPLPR